MVLIDGAESFVADSPAEVNFSAIIPMNRFAAAIAAALLGCGDVLRGRRRTSTYASPKASRLTTSTPSCMNPYGSKEKYVALVEAAAKRMQQDGFLLKDDAERVVAGARRQELGFQ